MDIFIAIPSYDGKVISQGVESLLKNTHILRDSGHNVKTFFYNGNCYIARARNLCVKVFLESDCTDMIFVDTDIAYDDDAMLKLIKYDKDVVGGVYPLKQKELDFPAMLVFDKETNNCKEEDTGLVEVSALPTGLLRINRTVFERMILLFHMKPDHEDCYSFFDTGMIFPDDNTWYGEDIAFCKRFKFIDGRMFIEPNITFRHYGSYSWIGNYHEWLMSRHIDVMNLDKNENGIDGWASETELKILSNFASRSDSIVEVGCWKGRSTKELLESCNGNVYAVDSWKGSPNDMTNVMAGMDLGVEAAFKKNVGHYSNLKILKGSSVDMAKTFNGNKVDMVYIDAGHTYEEVKSDIETWLPKCNKFIVGHDYQEDFPGVKQAVDEIFGEVNTIDTIWWVDLKGGKDVTQGS
jgi:hypothetical protein